MWQALMCKLGVLLECYQEAFEEHRFERKRRKLLERAINLVRETDEAGYVLRIERIAAKPLAMRHHFGFVHLDEQMLRPSDIDVVPGRHGKLVRKKP
jgi:hypothetical protein